MSAYSPVGGPVLAKAVLDSGRCLTPSAAAELNRPGTRPHPSSLIVHITTDAGSGRYPGTCTGIPLRSIEEGEVLEAPLRVVPFSANRLHGNKPFVIPAGRRVATIERAS